MNVRQRKTLVAVFKIPVSGTLEWSAVESLLVAVGCNVIEGSGSRVRFEKDGEVETFHRPHPAKDGKTLSDTRCACLSDPAWNNAMTNVMNYKGYSARIEYDDDDAILFGQIAGIRDGVGFHADNVEDLRVAFHEAVDDYIETCARLGKEPSKPYSGKVMFRIDPEVHARAARAAELSGKSLNEWAGEVLAKAAK